MDHVRAFIGAVFAHWRAIMVVITGLISIIGTVRNVLSYFGDRPKLKQLNGMLDRISDALAWVARNGHDGPLAMLPGWLAAISLPLLPSKPKAGPGAPLSALLPFVFFAGLAGIAAGSMLTGCANPLQSAQQTEGAVAKAVADTTMAWVEYDAKHQEELVAAATTSVEAFQSLKNYRDHVQTPVQNAIHDTRSALLALDDALAAVDAGKRKDWGAAVGPALAAVTELATLLQTLGVPIPVPALGGAK
jgi:hypothetical protein